MKLTIGPDCYNCSDRIQAVREAAYQVLDRMDDKSEDIRAAIESCGFDGDRAFADGIVLYLRGAL